MSSTTFRDKVQQLEQELAKCTKSIEGENCLPTMTIAAIATPIVLFLILYFLTPGFVKIKSGKKDIRSLKKVFIWTLGLSAITWGSMYGYNQYYTGGSICAK